LAFPKVVVSIRGAFAKFGEKNCHPVRLFFGEQDTNKMQWQANQKAKAQLGQ
jgi:hypothetical protein